MNTLIAELGFLMIALVGIMTFVVLSAIEGLGKKVDKALEKKAEAGAPGTEPGL